MIIEQHKQEMNDLQDILFAMEENAGEREGEARQEFQSLRDEIKNKVRAQIPKPHPPPQTFYMYYHRAA